MTWWLLLGCAVPDQRLDLVRNGSFDEWCGEAPCDWETAGSVRPVPTWSPGDRGVTFRTAGALLQELGAHPPWLVCVEGEVMVDGAPDLRVELDFGSDGVAEWSREIEGGSWHLEHFRIQPPIGYRGLTLALRAGGEGGEHVLGHVRLVGTTATDCELLDAGQVVGAPCRDDAECGDAGRCVDVSDLEELWSPLDWSFVEPGVCSTCESDEDCGDDELCGAGWGEGPRLARQCAPRAGSALGEVCGADAQCGSGTCCHGRCAECCEDGACGDGGQCRARTSSLRDVPKLLTAMCEVGPRPAGDACLEDRDCVGTCVGEPLALCYADGRSCATDDDCPGARPGDCEVRGVRDGTCG